MTALAWQKRALTVVNLAGTGVAVWMNQYPSEAGLYACLGAPVVMIVLAAAGGFALMWDDDDARLKLTWGFLPPLLALAVCALFDMNLFDKDKALIPGVVVAIAILAVVFAIDRRFKLWMTVTTVVIVFAGSWGGIMVATFSLDRSAATVYRADIVHKYRVRARRGNINYTIETKPWGPAGMPTSIDVSPDTYNSFHEGQALCFNLYPGAFGYRWYDFEACR